MDGYIEPDDRRYSSRALGLVRIGRDAIAKPDDAALDDYFASDYVLHGPDGDVDLAGLKGFFAGMRVAFPDFACERLAIVEQDNLIACRTVMTGTFLRPLEGTAVGTVQPNGRQVQRHVMNIFRYDDDGRLAEEWVQYDNQSFFQQLGVKMGQLA